MANVVSLFGRVRARKQDWSQAEIAEFYRIEGALIRAGIRVGTERGLTDEGDPWFVFFRADDGEVVIHLARIDGEYVLVGSAYQHVARGPDFGELVRDLIDNHPMVRAGAKRGSNIRIHPAAMLIAIIGAAFFKSGEARADDGRGDRKGGGGGNGDGVGPGDPLGPRGAGFQIEARQAAAILASVFLVVNGVGSSDHLLAVDHSNAQAGSDIPAFGLMSTSSSSVNLGDGRLNLDVRLPSESSETLSKALALLAILKDLERAAASGQDGGGEHGPAHVAEAPGAPHGEAIHADAQTIQAALPEQLDHVVIELLLKMDALPDVEAVRLIKQVAPGLAASGDIAVTTVEHLPDALVALIRAGIHAEFDAQPHTTSAASGLRFDASTLGDQMPSFVSIAQKTPATSDLGTGGHLLGDASLFDPSPSLSKSFGALVPQDAANGLVGKFVSFFLQHSTNVDVIVSGREIVLVDEQVLAVNFAGRAETVTFKLTDGSSISLVGQSQILHDTLSQWG